QMVGGECTATSDIYSLGIVMFEMIAGRRPFDDANSAAAALAAALTTTPERLSARAAVPADGDRGGMGCPGRPPAERFHRADELADALDEILLDGDEAATHLEPAARAPDAGFATTLTGPPPAHLLAPTAPLVAPTAPPGAPTVSSLAPAALLAPT